MKMTGPRTTSTSAKVDRRAHVQRTHMVDTFQVNTLKKTKKPANANRRHVWSICRGEGHHPQTCKAVLAPEHTERADLSFTQLIRKNKALAYLDLWAKRGTRAFVSRIAERIRTLTGSAGDGDPVKEDAGNGQS